jgi:hypothetical protein
MSMGYVIGSPEKARRLGHWLAVARVKAASLLRRRRRVRAAVGVAVRSTYRKYGWT